MHQHPITPQTRLNVWNANVEWVCRWVGRVGPVQGMTLWQWRTNLLHLPLCAQEVWETCVQAAWIWLWEVKNRKKEKRCRYLFFFIDGVVLRKCKLSCVDWLPYLTHFCIHITYLSHTWIQTHKNTYNHILDTYKHTNIQTYKHTKSYISHTCHIPNCCFGRSVRRYTWCSGWDCY